MFNQPNKYTGKTEAECMRLLEEMLVPKEDTRLHFPMFSNYAKELNNSTVTPNSDSTPTEASLSLTRTNR